MSIAKEFQWAATTFEVFAQQLVAFTEYSRELSRAVMQSRFDAATKLLTECEQTYGKSLWLIKNRLAVLQLGRGFDAQKQYAAEITGDRAVSGIVQIITHYVSVRNETALSPGPFAALYRRHVAAVDLPKAIQPYIDHHILPHRVRGVRECREVITFESSGTLIDYFEATVEVAAAIHFHDRRVFNESVTPALRRISEFCADSRIQRLAAASGCFQWTTQNGSPEVRAFDAFLAGKYDDAVESALAALEVEPDSTGVLQILARASAAHGDPLAIDSKAMNLQVAGSMRAIIDKGDRLYESVTHLKKLALNFSSSPWADDLVGFCAQELSSTPVSESAHVRSSYQLPPPVNALYAPFVPSDVHPVFLSGAIAAFPESRTRHYVSATNSPGAELANVGGLSAAARTLAEADRALLTGNFEAALAHVDRLLEVGDTFYMRKAACIRAYCVYRLERTEEAVKYVTSMYLNDRRSHVNLPLAELAQLLAAEPQPQLCGDPSVAILYDMYSRHVDGTYDSQRQYAYEDFLTAHGIERPSSLASIWNQFNAAKGVYFLRYVCLPHVMDSSLAFNGTKELEDERLAVCRLLIAVDKANQDCYETEIKDITRRQVVRRGIKEIERSKIYVNIDGVRKAATRSLGESFLRYRTFESSAVAGQAIERVMESLRSVRPEDSRVVVVFLPTNEKDEILQRLVTDIRDEYVSGTEHGLNGYLSVRVRHGTLTGQLRRPLDAVNLLTQRKGATHEYKRNEYWDDRLAAIDEWARARVLNRLDVFSRGFDALVEKIISEWLQVRRLEEEDGLFDFRICEPYLATIASTITTETTFEEFLDSVLAFLGQLLESNLEQVRDRLATEAKLALDNLLSDLQAGVSDVGADEELVALENSITSARTELRHTLNRIIDWFKLPEQTSAQPCSLALAVTIAAESVRTLHERFEFRPTVDAPENAVWPGRMLHNFVDIFFILFDNIVKHSGTTRCPEVLVRIEEGDGEVRILVENEIGADVRTDEAEFRLERIRVAMEQGDYKRSIGTEGGTGLHKIRKIIHHDLGRQMEMCFGYKEARFFVEIRMKSGLKERAT